MKRVKKDPPLAKVQLSPPTHKLHHGQTMTVKPGAAGWITVRIETRDALSNTVASTIDIKTQDLIKGLIRDRHVTAESFCTAWAEAHKGATP